MKTIKLLRAAGVPSHLHEQAETSIKEAKRRARGLFWLKWRARLFRNKEIARMLSWEHERLIDVRPDLAEWDIAPVLSVTAHGDSMDWDEATQRPVAGVWLDKDPNSDDYRHAVSRNYWCEGEHPRSEKSRAAWYGRNAGEYEAWRRGMPVADTMQREYWQSKNGKIEVFRCGDAWQIKGRVWGFVSISVGFEIANVFWWRAGQWVQNWYPIAGHELRAPVTWSFRPKF